MFKRLLLLALPTTLLLGCYPSGPEYVEDIDVVYTTHDEAYDFSTKNTYAMPDQIVVDVEIEDGVTTPVFMKDVLADPILAAIEDKMSEYGWTRETENPENADIILTPAAIKSTTYFYSYWYDWWYGGWYGGYWGWYYPPYYTVSSYTTGSMIIVMSDPSTAEESPIGQSQTTWISVSNGLFTGAYDISRVTRAIDQAFEQSPYLKVN